MEPIQPTCRTQSFLEPRFSLVKKQLQLGHLAGCIYPGEALNNGRYLCFLGFFLGFGLGLLSDLPTSAYPDFRICRIYVSLRIWPCTAGWTEGSFEVVRYKHFTAPRNVPNFQFLRRVNWLGVAGQNTQRPTTRLENYCESRQVARVSGSPIHRCMLWKSLKARKRSLD